MLRQIGHRAEVKELKSEPQHIDVVFLEVPKKNRCAGGVHSSDEKK